tara:strand:+ start:599 stop:865 length:267 start_codon:yes stop_codon:yes gene_type:complete
MAYKGVLPSDLWERYDCEGGHQKMLLDLNVANDIQDRIAEVTEQSKGGSASGKQMVARRKQRQAKRQLLSDSEGLDMLRSMGVAFDKQ